MGTSQTQFFAASGVFVVPANVTSIFVTMVGGGGSGGPTISPPGFIRSGAGGGGSGEFVRRLPIKCTPGQVFTVTVGAGGAIPGAGPVYKKGNDGGNTAFGTFVVQGGEGGWSNYVGNGGLTGGKGGGIGGAPIALFGAAGGPGSMEGLFHTGGSSGAGAVSNTVVVAPSGGDCEGFHGGRGGTRIFYAPGGYNIAGGSGGAASPFGDGGDGADGGGPPSGSIAPVVPTSHYGAGGGGCSMYGAAAAGVAGCVLVEWIA